MDDFIQGLSGMFYSFIERDLIRVYNEHKEEQKRKQQRSLEQAASEEELLKQIEIESKKDIEYLKNFKHSQYYGSKPESEWFSLNLSDLLIRVIPKFIFNRA